MSRPADVRSFGERIFGLVLLAYPPAFRTRHGADLRGVFRDAERDRRGRADTVRLLAEATLDALRTAPLLWLETLGGGDAPAVGESRPSGFAGFGADLQYAVRTLRREPTHTLAALTTLALGIGANAALFSVADRVLLRPLPYADPDRLVAVWDTRPVEGRDHEPPSPGNFLDWSARCASFAGMAAWQDGSGASTLRGAQDVAVVETVKVTPAFFEVLGVEAGHGRTFDPARERGAGFDVADRFRGGDRVLVISHGLWTSRFGADPKVVGTPVVLDGVPWEVIGVAPESLGLPRPTTQVFLPWDIVPSYAGFDGGPPRDYRFLHVLARLGAGVSLAAAQDDLAALARGLAEAHPKENAGWSVRVSPLALELVADTRPAILLLAGAVALVLLLACANVASLQIARASARRREMAVRLALGASRGRLVRQLLTESAVLAVVGGSLGLLVAQGALAAILSNPPEGLGPLAGVGLNGRVVLFTALVSMAAAVAFGVAPAFEASRAPLAGALQDGGRSVGGQRARRLRRVLVVGEVAAALVLLAGAGLLGRSFLRLLAVDVGFDPRGLVSLRVSLDHATYKTGAQSRAFYRELMQRLTALPGVDAAAAVTALPLSPVATDFARPYWREGEPNPEGNARKADIRMATPGYFDTLRMTVRRGRPLEVSDGEASPRVIVVNETLARQAFGSDEGAVGRRLVLDYMGGAYPYEVVGVVNDVRFGSVKAVPRPELYIPHAQNPYLDLTVVVRGAADAAELARRVQREITAIDPQQPAHAVATMDQLVQRSRSRDRFAAALLGFLALLALALTATGVQGLLAFLVAQRTQELGLRQALGATRSQVVGLVLSESLRLAAAGCTLGIAAGFVWLPQVAGLLYEVRPADPLSWVAALTVVLGAALVASLVPARAAARLDPLRALRVE